MQNDLLLNYLSKDINIQKMLNYIFYPDKVIGTQEKKAHYAFFSYKTISECAPQIVSSLL